MKQFWLYEKKLSGVTIIKLVSCSGPLWSENIPSSSTDVHMESKTLDVIENMFKLLFVFLNPFNSQRRGQSELYRAKKWL